MAPKANTEEGTDVVVSGKNRKRPPLFREPNAKGEVVYADEIAGLTVHFQNHPDATNRNGRVKVPNDYLLVKRNKDDKNPTSEWEYDPYKTSDREFEKQFGEGDWYVEPYGHDGGFMTGRNITLVGPKRYQGQPGEPPSAKAVEEDEDEEGEAPEDAVERLETEAAERDEKIEELQKKILEMASAPVAPAVSPMAQLKESFEAMSAMGVGPQANNTAAQFSQQREQWWQEQLSSERQRAANTLEALRTTMVNDLSLLAVRHEGIVNKQREEMNAVITALNAQLVQANADRRNEIQAEREARVIELKRRDESADATISQLKTALSNSEIRYSDLRRTTDDKLSALTGDGNTQLLHKLQSELFLNFEKEKVSNLTARANSAEKDLSDMRIEKLEMLETISVMKAGQPTRDALAEAVNKTAGFRIPPIVMQMLAPLVPLIMMFAVKWFMDKKSEMPKEARDFFEQWQKATDGKTDPQEWAAEQERNRQDREKATQDQAESERREEDQRERERQETQRRSQEYEETQARLAQEKLASDQRAANQRAAADQQAMVDRARSTMTAASVLSDATIPIIPAASTASQESTATDAAS